MIKVYIDTILYNAFTYVEKAINYIFVIILKIWKDPAKKVNSNNAKVLIFRADRRIGDFILFSASLPAFRKLYQNSKLILLITKEVYDLAKNCPYVDEIICLDVKKFRRNIFERWKWFNKLRLGNYDLAINAVYSTSNKYLDCLVGWTKARRRIAHQCIDTVGKRVNCNMNYTELVPADEEWKFEIDRNYDLLRYLGYFGSVNRKTEVWTKREDCITGQNLLNNLQKSPYAILIPGAGAKLKIWDANNFIHVVQKVNQIYGMHWIVCGGFSEIKLCEHITKKLINKSIAVENYAGKVNLNEFCCLIENAVFCLGNDTGAIHIAAAVNTPVICILGGGHYGRFYPYPNNQITFEVINKLPCYYCYWYCIFKEPKCITGISADKVSKKTVELLNIKFSELSNVSNKKK
jgi:ADP-heptose:LPS heptosyltransferase